MTKMIDKRTGRLLETLDRTPRGIRLRIINPPPAQWMVTQENNFFVSNKELTEHYRTTKWLGEGSDENNIFIDG